MIVDLPSSTISAVNKKLVELRESGGVLALGRVLTLVIVTDDGGAIEQAIEAGNSASREHPCRVIVLARGQRRAAPGSTPRSASAATPGPARSSSCAATAQLAAEEAGAGMVMPLLLPDAPVVAWWPGEAPAVPSTDADRPARAAPDHRLAVGEEPDQGVRAAPGEPRRRRHRPGVDPADALAGAARGRAGLPPARHDHLRDGQRRGRLAVHRPHGRLAGRPARASRSSGRRRDRRRHGVGAPGAPLRAGRADPAGRAHGHAAPARPAGPADRAGPAHRAGLPGRGAAPAGPGRGVRRGAGRGRADLARPVAGRQVVSGPGGDVRRANGSPEQARRRRRPPPRPPAQGGEG